MINRILIRIKVVQMLYSHLLIENNFMLESQPTPPTKEKRFAYGLYLDFLVLLTRIASRVKRRGGATPLEGSRFIAAVRGDEKIKSLLSKYTYEPFPLEAAIDSLVDKVIDSGIFKNYVKDIDKSADPNADVKVWEDLVNLIIAPDAELAAVISRMDNYSLRGVERMQELLADTFANSYSAQGHYTQAVKELRKSLAQARELYMRLLYLPVEITALREQEIDEARHKYIVTDEDRNPNMKMVDNRLVQMLADDPVLSAYVEQEKLSWNNEDPALTRSLLKSIKNSDIYSDYMNSAESSVADDVEFWRNVFKYIIFRNDTFLEAMEDKSIFWNDDLEIIGTFVLKTLRRFEEWVADPEICDADPVLPMYKDEEDARFGEELFRYVVVNKEEYKRLIDEFVDKSSWDMERLAFMDVVIIMTALAEILNFPKIPTSVSINEYIEMAKSYSTVKSGNFVHGLLGAIVAHLRETGKLQKP